LLFRVQNAVLAADAIVIQAIQAGAQGALFDEGNGGRRPLSPNLIFRDPYFLDPA